MRNKTGHFWRYLFLGTVCTLSLAGVTGCSGGVNLPPFGNGQYVNLTEQSYGAADMLLQQSKNVINSETPLEIGMLTNIKRPSETNALGQIIASQIGARFVQLGYNVKTSPALDSMAIDTQPSSAAYSSQGGYADSNSKAMITGHYAVARKDVLVNLRIIEESSGKVLAAYDYSLPLNSDVRQLMAAEGDKGNSILGF